MGSGTLFVLTRARQGFVKGLSRFVKDLSRICPCKFRKKNFQDKSAQINIRTVPVDPPGQALSATPPISSGIVRNGFRNTLCAYKGLSRVCQGFVKGLSRICQGFVLVNFEKKFSKTKVLRSTKERYR